MNLRSWARACAAVAAAAIAIAVPAAARAQCIGQTPDVRTGAHYHAPREVASAANVSFCGGPVMHSQRVHVIYWAPAGSGLTFDPGYESMINTFLHQVAVASHSTSNVFGLMGQYHDSNGPAAYNATFAGAIQDSDPLPTDVVYTCTEPPAPPADTGPGWTACINDGGIQAEIARVVRDHHLPSGIGDMYMLLTPNGLGSCFESGPQDCALGGDANNGYCGYHSANGDPGIPYAVIPYNAVVGHCQSSNPRPNGSTADPTISTIAHEYAETSTDPLGTAWSDSSGNEIADLCITSYGRALGGLGSTRFDEVIDGGRYWIQELWSNFTHNCRAAARPDHLSTSGPGRAAGDREIVFAARASDPEGKIVNYAWRFGDGRTASGNKVTHAYLDAGTFTVTVRTLDSWGNWAYSTRQITVRRPPRPVVDVERGRVSGARATVRFSSSAAVATFECRIDRRHWTACRSPFSSSVLSPGSHRIYVRARDTFGQRSRRAAVYAFTVA
jgi:hypothetical protein